ncbi:hypothetical protein LL270_00855 [Pseudomonas aestusnigri]|uniref:hypothetical protein n=1 Tax=Halopseudomonas aestusnigri TaxID=857252 RepID=UPI001D18A27A|nr:hypothetical protein [Halopseudomonas aestusnigri]MCC4259203.1 hypothetical protein [Halopseudomonas aestusnigri]
MKREINLTFAELIGLFRHGDDFRWMWLRAWLWLQMRPYLKGLLIGVFLILLAFLLGASFASGFSRVLLSNTPPAEMRCAQ